MTMRSMPPASSHLAESPVPAPPPMIGSPRSIMVRSFSRTWALAMRGTVRLSGGPRPHRGNLAEARNERTGEGRIVDVVGQLDEPALGGRAEMALDGREERAVGSGIVERL